MVRLLHCRCVAQYGPSSYSYDVGNRAGGQFDRLGQAVKRLLEAFVSITYAAAATELLDIEAAVSCRRIESVCTAFSAL